MMTMANRITIARILMIPCFVMMVIYYGRSVQEGNPQEWQRLTAIMLFLVAAASDGLDGYVARKYNQKSRLGVILDPIADKGLLLAALITLSISNWHYEFPIWFPVLVITRDAVIVLGTVVLHYLNGTVQVRPSWLGKTATVCQMAAIGCAMLELHSVSMGSGNGKITLPDAAVYAAGLFTLLSGAGYVMDGIRQLHEGGHGHAGK
jgi:CDP-diacylglycerol--glycerol-3-phosphate 3-phosphatidyltransferase